MITFEKARLQRSRLEQVINELQSYYDEEDNDDSLLDEIETLKKVVKSLNRII